MKDSKANIIGTLNLEGLIKKLEYRNNKEQKPKAQPVIPPKSDTGREVQNTARANIWRPYESSTSRR